MPLDAALCYMPDLFMISCCRARTTPFRATILSDYNFKWLPYWHTNTVGSLDNAIHLISETLALPYGQQQFHLQSTLKPCLVVAELVSRLFLQPN